MEKKRKKNITCITCLPVEILLEIFLFLEIKDLKNCLLINKEFLMGVY